MENLENLKTLAVDHHPNGRHQAKALMSFDE
jgi:hypothetical protein